jgi:type II secretory pathway component GspD/PulD (secretin)
LLAKLDQAERRGALEVIRLKRADAAAVAEILVRLYSSYYNEGGRFTKRDSAGGLVVVPEPRSGSLVFRGDRRDVDTAIKLAQRLDQAEDPAILIRDLDNADAAALAARLQELLKGRKP